MNAKPKMSQGSGNVFLNVGFPPDEANNLILRAQLMTRVRDAARRASQCETAEPLGINRLRLNDVPRGRMDKFRLHALAGMRMELRFRKVA